MPVPLLAILPQLPPTNDGRARFSREAYHRVFESGALNPESRYELIDGEIVMMSPISSNQSDLVSVLAEFFTKLLPDGLQCRVQQPIVIGDHSEPEPDLAIVRRRKAGYRKEHPGPCDVVLLIEVAKTSLLFDLGEKLKVYALAGIFEYWVVDVDHQTIVVHRDPAESSYRQVQRFDRAKSLAPLEASNCQLDLDWLFTE